MKLSKFEEDILKLKYSIDKKFNESCVEKIKQIKNKLYKYKARKLYEKASKELYNKLIKLS